MEPIHLAIRRVGGPSALAGYDELLAHDPEPFEGAQFEVWQRDVIVQDLLTAAVRQACPARA